MINSIEDKELVPLSEVFKAFSDVTRLKILMTLIDEESLCVGDIASTIGMTDSAVSHQLKVLKNARLVKSQREGKLILYSIDDEHVKTMLKQGLIHIEHS